MEGYAVVTADDRRVGRVVGVHGDFVIVEQSGLLRARRPVPREFAHADDAARVVRITVPRRVLRRAPRVRGEFDEGAVAAYYGLASR